MEDFGFVVVKDQNDKIIYPIESARLNQIKHILMFGSINENEIELKNEICLRQVKLILRISKGNDALHHQKIYF